MENMVSAKNLTELEISNINNQKNYISAESLIKNSLENSAGQIKTTTYLAFTKQKAFHFLQIKVLQLLIFTNLSKN